MITDLLTQLTVEQLQRLFRPDMPADEADQKLAELDAALAERNPEARDAATGCSPQQLHLLDHYLRLALFDWDRLPTQAHGWFLERLTAAPALASECLPAIERLYFHSNDGLLRHVTVGTLLAVDRWARKREISTHSSVQGLWQAVLHDEVLSPEQKEQGLLELLEILVEHLDMTEPEAAQALGDLGRDLGFRGARHKGDRHVAEPPFREVWQRMHVWTEHLGGARAARLRRLFE